MNCIIVEDEYRALQHLEKQLAQTGYEINIQERLDTVEATVNWLKHNQTDLLFLDIQLGDAVSFEIFDHIEVTTPVIFTTSYNQYMARAFEVNSISYLLKPIKLELLKSALSKFNNLYPHEPLNAKIFSLNEDYQQRFLVESGTHMKTIPVDDVAYFRLQSKRFLLLTTKDNQQYLLDGNLEVLEQRLNPAKFFRVNRQFIVSIDAIYEMYRLDRQRIGIKAIPESKEEMIVSTEKSLEFKKWLSK